ncbi:TPA: hypothetical protein IBU82_004359 [Escherichia coli]|nr:hypothetical protein [Salmonella enterica subsp. enterica serovar Typhimurium]EER0547964.1 hypothetical protein [Escherichia coli]EFR7545112.1 hypothetical protein [Salmonella enterica]NOP44108.1 hypothetical protein [Klebsiella pneumoniae]HAN2949433.1 hypothetical protein [Escherichia coli O25b:H4-ST131]
MALSRVLPGWTQDDSYRIRRSGRAERGVRAHSPAWSERPTPSRDRGLKPNGAETYAKKLTI